MRCPKCGYISFDHQETCNKCQKYIGDVVADIKGTTFSAKAPSFLKITSADKSPSPLASAAIKESPGSSGGDEAYAFEADEET